jgi:hypothetical protein
MIVLEAMLPSRSGCSADGKGQWRDRENPQCINADLPKILRCQLWEHLPIDLVVAESRYIALKAQIL